MLPLIEKPEGITPKQKLMDDVIVRVRNCRKCRLWQYATNPVPGEGSLDASLMLIGEAPGYQEDLKGKPFAGRAGKILDKLLSGIDLRREDIYIGNVVKHRPPENRQPKEDEIKACTPYLDEQIRIIKPGIIVTLGMHSTRYILLKMNVEFERITDVRGQIYEGRLLDLQVKIMPTFHPAAVLHNPRYRSVLEEDFRKIKMELSKQHSQGIQ
ncbi:MAG: type-4 uracil-DNA glycosylase [Candidatus Methanoperedens sp.]|nr:type-4 uracil-DNA glycosylase [Candidatus Methanoperedens sp.]